MNTRTVLDGHQGKTEDPHHMVMVRALQLHHSKTINDLLHLEWTGMMIVIIEVCVLHHKALLDMTIYLVDPVELVLRMGACRTAVHLRITSETGGWGTYRLQTRATAA